MRIGIDAYPLTRERLTGLGTYLLNLIKHLEAIDVENEYFLYGCRDFQLPFKNNRWHVRLVKGPRLVRKISTFWLLFGASSMLQRDKIDVFLGTQNLIPIFLPASIKKILVINDLSVLVCPQTMPFIQYIAHRCIFKRSLFSADRIIAISHSTKDDIIKYFPHLKEEKITAVYDACSPEVFLPHKKEEINSYIKKRFSSLDKYILAVSSLEWRKNTLGLLRSYYLCWMNFNIKHKLLIAGCEKRAKTTAIERLVKELSLEDSVHFLGYVDLEELIYLYNGADVFVFPSFYEGFGLPPLEAMSCGTPVIASDIRVLREVLGDAALLVDPYNHEEMARGIDRVLTDQVLAENLRKKGLDRVKLFSWDKTAKVTRQILTN